MKIIGLTGGIATGKTTVSNYLKQLNVPIIDADVINKSLLEPHQQAYQKLLLLFPDIPVFDNLSLDKFYIRNHILSDQVKKQQLEQLLHPLIKAEIKHQIELLDKQSKYPYCIVSVAILIEANFQHLVGSIWITDCSEKEQIKRLMTRDKISQQDALKMLSHQLSRQQRLSYADKVIPTSNLDDMSSLLNELHKSI